MWSKKKPKNAASGVVFPGVQKSTWDYDNVAKAYYFHRFYDFQPDLNTSNLEVQTEILKIMGFWLQLGVSGFRMDAVPFKKKKKGPKVAKLKSNTMRTSVSFDLERRRSNHRCESKRASRYRHEILRFRR